LHKQRQKETIEKKKQRLEKNIQKNLQMAKKSGDDKRLQQVASRKKVKLKKKKKKKKKKKRYLFIHLFIFNKLFICIINFI